MAKTIDELMTSVKNALGADDLNGGILNPEKREEFLEEAVADSIILQDARKVDMKSHTYDIDRIAYADKMFTGAKTADGKNRTMDRNRDGSKPTFGQNQLIAKKFVGITSIHDDAVDINIEEERLLNRVRGMIARKAGNEFAEFGFLADTERTAPADDERSILHLSDGWLKKAGNKLFLNGAEGTVEDAFEEALLALPKAYIKDITQLKYYVDFYTFNEYHNILKARHGNLGDIAQTGRPELRYKTIKVVHEPTLDLATVEQANEGPGRSILLVNPLNMVYGIFKDIVIKTVRDEYAFTTDFITSLQGDVHFEDENGAVAVFLEQSYGEDEDGVGNGEDNELEGQG